MEESKLIKLAKMGDAEAFEQLLVACSNQLYRTAFIYMQNREDALDVVQETSYKAFKAISQLKENAYFTTWLTRILINTANEYLRVKQKDSPIEEMDIPFVEQDRIEQLDLMHAIHELPAKYRDVIILFYFHDITIKDISTSFHMPEGTVKTYLRRGREQLRMILQGGQVYEG
ncbi:sigma-70 family RNA polymerase sigma factor [Ornithinibacillus sp. 4-3]|uniref:Sigma-70 family RNA polymerase sigma factor n=1 Tax=Ornithinibacillus sp. 4-3 TaxID=3231488 RepID=A0AB39HNC0_9BACI